MVTEQFMERVKSSFLLPGQVDPKAVLSGYSERQLHSVFPEHHSGNTIPAKITRHIVNIVIDAQI